MNQHHLTKLAELAEDVVVIDGGELLGVMFGTMADGSGRSFALVSTSSAGLEQEYRIASPAPTGGPSWTWTMTEWSLEVRTGERWLALELELDDAGRVATAPELEAIAGGVDPAPIAAAADDDGPWEGPMMSTYAADEPDVERAYEIASADVVVALSRAEAVAIAESLDMLAGVDDGEHTDYDELVRLAGIVAGAVAQAEARS